MKNIAILAVAAAISLAPGARAESVGEQTGVNSVLGVAPTTADFVKEAATSDMTEIAASKIGRERGMPRKRLSPTK